MGKVSLNFIKIKELSARSQLEVVRQEGLDGVVGGGAGWPGGKASLNLIKITELSALRAVRQQGLDGGVGVGAWDGGGLEISKFRFQAGGLDVWARGVAGGGKGQLGAVRQEGLDWGSVRESWRQ